MQNTKKFLIFASLLFAACTSDPLQEPAGTAGDAGETAVSKICNTSAHARGTLIAKFDDEAVPTLEQAAAQYAATRSGGAMTRSGIAPVDEILADLHVTSLERVFPDAGEHEARTRAAGLHRWYVLAFDEEQGLAEHTAPFDALVQVLDGEAEIRIGGEPLRLKTGDAVIMPAGVPHALQAVGRFKMLLTMIKG